MATLLSDIVATSTAFSPGHVTGIFAPAEPQKTDILSTGSIGAGFSISRGITTTATTFEAKTKGYCISIDGIQVQEAPVSSYVAEYYLNLIDKPIFLQISHTTGIPIGFGLGSSGAAAVSLSYALNNSLNIGLSKVEAGSGNSLRRYCVQNRARYSCGVICRGVRNSVETRCTWKGTDVEKGT